MKIEELRFKNLNSLMGEWRIDFSDPVYDAAGIFAITGPTGAGKSTLLDAICLALYGQTPRLDILTKSSNDIMSRHTGDCFAEVTFVTQSGRYRVLWAQRRARKSPQGELQIPQRELADAVSGVILESSLRRVSEKIVELTGMDFDRFTRSVVLAQGKFAAFLQASADERAPILEHITGTSVYSKISIAVHTRLTRERELLVDLGEKWAGVPVLDTETLASVTADHARYLATVGQLQPSLSETHHAILWYEQRSLLETALGAAQSEWAPFWHYWQSEAPERDRLQVATRARVVAGEYAQLVSLRTQQTSAVANVARLVAALPQIESQYTQAQAALAVAQKARETAKEKETLSRPLVQAMRQRDSQIQNRQKEQLGQKAARDKAQESYAEVQYKIAQTTDTLTHAQTALAGVQDYMSVHQDDAQLAESWASLRDHAKRMVIGVQELTQADTAWMTTAGEYKQLTALMDTQNEAVRLAQSVRETSFRDCSTAEATLNALLADGDEATLRLTLDTYREQLRQIQSHIATHQKRQKLQQTGVDLGITHAELILALETACAHRDSLTRELNLLEHTQQLMTQIQSLSALRGHLVDGDPCPLCGSDTHPYAVHGTPDMPVSDILAAKERLSIAMQDIQAKRVTEARVLADIQHTQTTLHALDTETTWPTNQEDLRLAEHAQLTCIAHLETQLEGLLLATKAMSLAKETLTKAKDHWVLAEQNRQTTERQHALLQQQHSTQQQTAQGYRDACHAEWQQFCSRLSGDKGFHETQHAVTELSPTAPPSVFAAQLQQITGQTLPTLFEQLKTRRSTFASKTLEKEALEKTVLTETAALAGHTQMSRHLEKTLADIQSHMATEDTRLQESIRERQVLYGEQDPDRLEAETTAALSQADMAYDTTREIYDTATTERQQAHVRHEEAVQLCQRYDTELQTLDSHCLTRFQALEFTDEAAYLAARLSESDYALWQQKWDALDKEKTVLETRLADKERQLKRHTERCPTETSLTVLRDTHAQTQTEIEGLQREIGALAQRLADHDKLSQQRSEHAAALTAQQQRYKRVAALHELIGSADGKKYRNFAQGLTFERMVRAANHHLHRMTDRYTLARDTQQPLLLNVVDHYQGDALRVTRNLSGGESFIVSLALALGLSQLSSRNVRLDSLFLDEGFGTLSEEVLETALSTLSSLHQEGKRIGVISHVQALKDRIGTQIVVYPESGGRSGMEGPGVFRVS